jgi:hypothetical protein
MNTYEIEGKQYKASNDYEAVKSAYKMADKIELRTYLVENTWSYNVNFKNGRAFVVVKKV